MPGSPWRIERHENGTLWVHYDAGGNRVATDGDVWAAARIEELEDCIRALIEMAYEPSDTKRAVIGRAQRTLSVSKAER